MTVTSVASLVHEHESETESSSRDSKKTTTNNPIQKKSVPYKCEKLNFQPVIVQSICDTENLPSDFLGIIVLPCGNRPNRLYRELQ